MFKKYRKLPPVVVAMILSENNIFTSITPSAETGGYPAYTMTTDEGSITVYDPSKAVGVIPNNELMVVKEKGLYFIAAKHDFESTFEEIEEEDLTEAPPNVEENLA